MRSGSGMGASRHAPAHAKNKERPTNDVGIYGKVARAQVVLIGRRSCAPAQTGTDACTAHEPFVCPEVDVNQIRTDYEWEFTKDAANDSGSLGTMDRGALCRQNPRERTTNRSRPKLKLPPPTETQSLLHNGLHTLGNQTATSLEK
mmetsp:Transcript_27012/g.71057  ORF Transcript_27012/g.71057 Transcript_27012/m.71057 type:complete len:146 (-) Transcript_27012:94-531(-)